LSRNGTQQIVNQNVAVKINTNIEGGGGCSDGGCEPEEEEDNADANTNAE